MRVQAWPRHIFSIDTRLPQMEASARLASQVEPPRWLRLGGGDKPFQGEFYGRHFSITRIIRYRNSFLPVVTGSVEPSGAGSRVQVHMRMQVFVMAFLVVWIIAAIAMGIGIASEVAAHSVDYDPLLLLVPVGMIAFVAAMSLGGFWFEANKQERMLRELFAGGVS